MPPTTAPASRTGTASPPPRSPLLDLPGAVPAQGQDTGVAWHYGDPAAEERALAAGAAVVDLSHRGVLRITGPDRLSWLHSLTTQHLKDLSPEQPTEALLLSPQGHIEHALHLVEDGEVCWITVEPGRAGPLASWLDSMRFLVRVQVEDVTADWAVIGEVGEGTLPHRNPAPRNPAPRNPVVWTDPWPCPCPGSALYTSPRDQDGNRPGPQDDPGHPGHDRPWREVLVERRQLAAAATSAPRLAGTWAAEALRVAAHRPRAGAETDHRTVPHELDWLRTAVHLSKGCYRGQETVAKIHNRGKPPRRLTLLHLDGSEHVLPDHGAVVTLDGRDVGRVTTPARHSELGPIALAVLSGRAPFEADLLVQVEGDGWIAAAQEPIVCP
ncbi:MAG: tRNA-modifying protein YgfZ [Actinomycetota bacterium]|nr:tRNA-modifying protein YgfZ [Actinomycetota bacterium]